MIITTTPSIEGKLIQARQNALLELEQRAIDRGADAVVGVESVSV